MKGGMDFSTPPNGLFVFQSADLLQIGKSIGMSPKIDVFPFHIICLHIQAEKGCEYFMFLAGKINRAFPFQQL